MADDEDADADEAPQEEDDVPEEAEDQGDEGEDETPEEAADDADEEEEAGEDEGAEDGDDDEDTEGDEVPDEADVDEDGGDEVPEEAEDADEEGDETPEEAADAEEDGEEETADEETEAAGAEGDEELEEIETAMAGEGEEDEEEPPSQPTVSTDGRFYGTGRRKEAVARVWIEAGSGEVTVNGNDLSAYFSSRAKWTGAVRGPLECLGMEDSVDVWATAEGGGLTGQAEAIELGLARALVDMDENARHWLRPEGHLTRDDREVERKKINQPGARAKSQVSKR